MAIVRDIHDPEIRQIDLQKYMVPDAGDISFLRAEWWDDSSRFVVVRYALKREEVKTRGFRLDLDKKVFLDHVSDPKLDKEVQDRVDKIWHIVVAERFSPVASAIISVGRAT
jgi:hypothetical protein